MDRKSSCRKEKINDVIAVNIALLIVFIFFFLLFPQKTSAVTVDSAVNTDHARHTGQSPSTVFISDQTGYTFFVDSGGTCAYSKTTNGGTNWGTAVNVDTQTDCLGVTVWYDQWTPGDTTGTIIHILTWDSGSSDLWYTTLNTTGDTLSSIITITGNGQGGSLTAGANAGSITKATNGTLYAGMVDSSDSYMEKCSTSCTQRTNRWSEATTSPFTNGDDDTLNLVPLSSGSIMAIWWDVSASTIASQTYNGTAWAGSWTSIATSADKNTTYDESISVTLNKTNNDISLVFIDDASTLGGNDDDIKTYLYNGTWTAKSDVLSNVLGRAITGVSISYDQNYSDTYVSYVIAEASSYMKSANSYYKYSRDGMTSWGAEFGPLNTLSDDIYGLRGNFLSSERLFVTWYENSDNSLKGVTINNTVAAIERIYPDVNGIQSTSLSPGSTNNYIGSAFTFVRSSGTANITSIKITDKGSIYANSYLSNLDIYYESAVTCSYDGNETLFGTAGSFNSTDEATVTGTMSVGTSQICVYILLDIASGGYGTIDLEISNPSSDILLSAGNILQTQRLKLVGGTNVRQTGLPSPVTVDSSVINSGLRHLGPSPSLVFTNDQTGYSFYIDSSGSCVYAKTTDGGVTWGSAVTVDTQTDCLGIGIWYDRWTPGDTTGSLIHIATFDSGNSDVWYTALNTSNDSLTTTLNASVANQGGSFISGLNNIAITKSTNNYITMGIVDDSDSFVIRCITNCSVSATNWTEAGTNPFTGDNGDYLILMPVPNGDIMAIWWDISVSDILSRTYEDTGNSWGASWTTIDSDADVNSHYGSGISATIDKDTNDIYLVYIDDSTRIADNTDDLKSAIYSGASWTTKTNLLTNDPRGISGVTITLDSLTNYAYVSYSVITDITNFTQALIYNKQSKDSMTSWENETGSYDAVITNEIYGLRSNMTSDSRIYTTWYTAGADDLLGTTVYDIEPAITVSGNVYNSGTTNALTACDSSMLIIETRNFNKTLKTSCDDATGAWSFSSNVPMLPDGTGIVVWIDGQSKKGSITVRYDGTGDSINNIFYDDTVTVISDSTSPITNSVMDRYDSEYDTDIPYTVTTGNLSILSGYKFNVTLKSGVASGSTVFDPGGTVTTSQNNGDFLVGESAQAYLDSSSNSVGKDIIIENGGSLFINADTLVSGGDIQTVGNAILSYTSGTPTVTLVGSGTLGGGSSPITIYKLSLSGMGTTILNSDINVNSDLVIGNGTDPRSLDLETYDNNVDVNGNVNIGVNAVLVASSVGDLFIGGNWINEGTFTANSSTVTMDASSGTKTIEPGTNFFNDIVLNDGGGNAVFLLENNLIVNGSISILNGTLDVNQTYNYPIYVSKNWTNADIFEARNGIVTFDTSSPSIIDSGCSDVNSCISDDFYQLLINKTNNTDTVTLSNSNLKTLYDLSISRGVLIQGVNNIRSDGPTAVTIGANGTWSNLSTGDIILGGNLVNNGVLTFRSSDSCGAADDIVITSSNGTPTWSGTGSYELKDVNIANQNASVTIVVYSSTNGGGNTGSFIFLSGCTPGSLVTGIVDTNGDPIATPLVPLTPKSVSINHQTASGTFGESSQKMRVSNTTINSAWTLSLAPSSGASALWTGSSESYDFNDPSSNASDGADSDNYGGQLTVNPSTGNIAPQSGCSTTGLVLGTQAAYNEDLNINSITLISAGSNSPIDCYWDLTDISINQTIPAAQKAQSYSIDMTLSVIAN
jgi:hypothetical protein